jgi:hypothetical protein
MKDGIDPAAARQGKLTLYTAALGLILVLSWLFRPPSPNPRNPVAENNGRGPQRAFAENASRPPPPLTTETAVLAHDALLRQLDRHARMKALGYYDNILGNPATHPEIRRRVQSEFDRLETLVAEHPELADEAGAHAYPPAFDKEGKPNPQLAAQIDMMRRDGAWEKLHAAYIESLRVQAHNPETAEGERPSDEEIQRAIEQGLVPYF